MDNVTDSGHDERGRNMMDGHVQGALVQANIIHGGVHVDQSRTVNQTVYSDRRTTVGLFAGLASFVILAFGGYLGLAVAGVINVVTGQVFVSNSPWPAAALPLALFGTFGALIVALMTRRRFFPGLRHRTWIFVGIGFVTLPLAFAVPDEQHGMLSAWFYFGGFFGALLYKIVMRLARDRS